MIRDIGIGSIHLRLSGVSLYLLVFLEFTSCSLMNHMEQTRCDVVPVVSLTVDLVKVLVFVWSLDLIFHVMPLLPHTD